MVIIRCLLQAQDAYKWMARVPGKHWWISSFESMRSVVTDPYRNDKRRTRVYNWCDSQFYIMNKIKFAVVGCKRSENVMPKWWPVIRCRTGCLVWYSSAWRIGESRLTMFLSWFAKIAVSNKVQVDVVNVCTPEWLTCSMAVQAVEAGCNVVMVPMAWTLADAEKVAHASLEISYKAASDAEPLFSSSFCLD